MRQIFQAFQFVKSQEKKPLCMLASAAFGWGKLAYLFGQSHQMNSASAASIRPNLVSL